MKPKIKLSIEAKELISMLRINKDSFIRKRMNHQGNICWGLLNKNFIILKVYPDKDAQQAINTTFLKRCENGYCFNQQ